MFEYTRLIKAITENGNFIGYTCALQGTDSCRLHTCNGRCEQFVFEMAERLYNFERIYCDDKHKEEVVNEAIFNKANE